ncbi:MAG: GNAT family N-acetyltransferase, partial [Solirubrobacterales bacterium]
EWVEFVAGAQGAEPVIGELTEGSAVRGYFTGLTVRRFGVPILGSPMPGWTTGFMGFNLEPGVSRREATEALVDFAFGSLGCAHLELKDHELDLAEVEGLGFDHTAWHGLEVDLSPPEDEVFASFKSACRTAIRKAEKQGIVVEEAEVDGFVEDFYPQMQDVFAKQNLVPTFGPDRIRELIRHVHPTGRLLLLRARDSEGTPVATGIFPFHNRTIHFLSGASWRSSQSQRPNEALMWHAMRFGKQRGMQAMDLGGFMSYKQKWGGRELRPPHLRKSRSGAVAALRDLAQRAFVARVRLAGKLRRGGGDARE